MLLCRCGNEFNLNYLGFGQHCIFNNKSHYLIITIWHKSWQYFILIACKILFMTIGSACSYDFREHRVIVSHEVRSYFCHVSRERPFTLAVSTVDIIIIYNIFNHNFTMWVYFYILSSWFRSVKRRKVNLFGTLAI